MKLRRKKRNYLLIIPCFRWVKPAASLKRHAVDQGRQPDVWFPLGKTGGLIEAGIAAADSRQVVEVSAG